MFDLATKVLFRLFIHCAMTFYPLLPFLFFLYLLTIATYKNLVDGDVVLSVYYVMQIATCNHVR